jgi:prepilin-type N-terminal cleavage/methylation domain-containing protein
VNVARQEGFTLIEVVISMAILGLIMGGISILFVSGTKAESDLSARFTAQTELHIGLDRLRRDVHSACTLQTQSATSVTVAGPPCDVPVVYTWCTQGSGSHFGLYRVTGATCSGGIRYSDFLTSGSVFSYLGPNTTPAGTNSFALARLHVAMTIDANTNSSGGAYSVVDDIVFRNSARCTAGVDCP